MGIYMSYKNNRDNRDVQWRANIEQRISSAETSDRIHDVNIQTIKETLKETKESIKDVKQGVDKLVERLIK